MDPKNNVNIRIGDVLLELGYVNSEQIAEALKLQESNKGLRMGDALVQKGFITERQMLQALATRLDYELVNLSDIYVDIDATALIPQMLAEKYLVLGYQMDDNSYKLLVNDPMNFYGIEDIRQIVGRELVISLCEREQIENAIRYYYPEVLARDAATKAAASAVVNDAAISLDNMSDDTPIVNLINNLMRRGYSSNVSDIHIEPYEHDTHVRMRMDGVIMDFMTLPRSIHGAVIARVKILGDMDIAERRIPQDGHFRTIIDGKSVHVRVSVIPTVYGEKAVLRLLSGTAIIDREETFGMDAETYAKVSRMLMAPNGMIYVTGPTGSGKSTTLYMILTELAKKNVNISTIEDPVEKNVLGLNQMQVNNQAGLTFETGLRALLRQDPDIIMVGETRDTETAQIASRAAITGHLVLSTLHTNDAASSIIRLVDMGVEPYMIAGSLVGIIAQRLVRKVCPMCGEWGSMTDEEIALSGVHLRRVMRPRGCVHCNNTGYKGRQAIHEVMPVNRIVREMVTSGATTQQLKDYAINDLGMKTLKTAAIELVEKGITTVEELIRVAYKEVDL